MYKYPKVGAVDAEWEWAEQSFSLVVYVNNVNAIHYRERVHPGECLYRVQK